MRVAVSDDYQDAALEIPVPYFDANYEHLRFPLARTGIPGVRVAQLAAVHALSAHFFARKEPAIVVMPTGSGKSAVMVMIAFVLRTRRILALTLSRMVCAISLGRRSRNCLFSVPSVHSVTISTSRVCTFEFIPIKLQMHTGPANRELRHKRW
jgi:hypothetical protein